MSNFVRPQIVIISALGDVRCIRMDLDSGSLNKASEAYNSKDSTVKSVLWIILLPPQYALWWNFGVTLHEYAAKVLKPDARAGECKIVPLFVTSLQTQFLVISEDPIYLHSDFGTRGPAINANRFISVCGLYASLRANESRVL